MDFAASIILRDVGFEAFDTVAGGETAGIPFAAWLSDRLNVPMQYVRKKPKGFGRDAQIKTHAILEIPEEYHHDLRLRKVSKFFDGPSIGAVKDSTKGAYHVIIENVTLEGFKYNSDKKILTPEDARPGKWPQALKRWKSDRGISDQ